MKGSKPADLQPVVRTGQEQSWGQEQGVASGPHLLLLAILTAAFLFRVMAQLLQALWPLDVLPSFESWHSATLPYPLLLASQLAILAVQVWLIVVIARHSLRPRRQVGLALLVVGSLYFTFMLFRLIAGVTFFAHLPWFQARLPTIFHLVLAAFLLVLADFHLRFARPATA